MLHVWGNLAALDCHTKVARNDGAVKARVHWHKTLVQALSPLIVSRASSCPAAKEIGQHMAK